MVVPGVNQLCLWNTPARKAQANRIVIRGTVESLGHRARIFCWSRTVPRLLTWTEVMLSQPVAFDLSISFRSPAPCLISSCPRIISRCFSPAIYCRLDGINRLAEPSLSRGLSPFRRPLPVRSRTLSEPLPPGETGMSPCRDIFLPMNRYARPHQLQPHERRGRGSGCSGTGCQGP